MELAKSFEPSAIEAKWYPEWESRGYFKPSWKDGAPPYCIQLPPPNVTGTLHMGHAFQHTLIDVLIRWQRMLGSNTLWQLGTDHAGIATQIVVENQLKAEGTSRADVGREKFVERVWQWKQESGSTITNQMRRLGTSGDWSRERFTMDEGLSAAVVETFVRLFEDGLIYRGKRLVNWDPKLGTAVSDLEVESEEEQGKIWEIRYPRVDGRGDVVVATTRPETMLGDVAVAVNPDDERYTELVGKEVTLPLTGRTIRVIADSYVDKEFGTGCVKITPAHDFNDWAIGQRHGLAPIGILNLDATISDNAPAKYRGLDRYAARKAVLADLAADGLVVSEKPHRMVVPRCGRTGEIVEPMLTDQWFVAMRTPAPAGHPYFPGKSIQDLCLAAVDAGVPSPRTGEPGQGRVRPVGMAVDVPALDQQHPGLVHFAPTLVGPPDSRVVRRERQRLRCPRRGRGAREGEREARTRPGSTRRRIPTFSTPGSPRRCGATRRSAGPATDRQTRRTRGCRRSCRRTCSSPASTSSSSGSRGW